ncbi:methyltransferase domain-containing protein [Acinetobacter defluvii]|uniref:methyltransferase domain-containing protein n=1 Tax=Acinetobacter defluvii TaxID=1871111 RepID=UPI003AF4F2F3
MGHVYKDSFFNYIDLSSSRSAQHFLKVVEFPFEVNTILDVGCGRGAWLVEWGKLNKSIFGVDGAYVDSDSLLISKLNFSHQDISKKFSLNKSYDLVQCLEVAEHLKAEDSDILITNLVNHGNIILFSAAIPGQGGEFHVNEQPLNYWVKKFEKQGYACFDFIRPQIVHEKMIEPWYRFNTLLFVKKDCGVVLNEKILNTKVNSEFNFNKLVSNLWLIRNSILRILPDFMINFIAKIKHYTIAMKK